jgi:hypothetical protein
MEQDKTEFPISAWPGIRLPIPPLRPNRYRLLESALFLVGSDQPASESDEEVCSVGEVYLELLRVDLNDPEAIANFANRFGTVAVYEPPLRWPALDYVVQHETIETLVTARLAAGAATIEWGGYTNMIDEDPEIAALDVVPEEMDTLAEFRLAVQSVQDGLTAWRLLKHELRSSEVRWALPGEDTRTKAKQHELRIHDFLPVMLYQGLAPARPAIEIKDEELKEFRASHHPYGFMGITESLYFRCCLELYNHMVEQAEYRECANPSCQRLFVRQRGGAAYGQYRRKGVRYCSPRCARQQAVRKHRQRKAEQGAGSTTDGRSQGGEHR